MANQARRRERRRARQAPQARRGQGAGPPGGIPPGPVPPGVQRRRRAHRGDQVRRRRGAPADQRPHPRRRGLHRPRGGARHPGRSPAATRAARGATSAWPRRLHRVATGQPVRRFIQRQRDGGDDRG